jgi:hypothetical protein
LRAAAAEEEEAGGGGGGEEEEEEEEEVEEREGERGRERERRGLMALSTSLLHPHSFSSATFSSTSSPSSKRSPFLQCKFEVVKVPPPSLQCRY